jgi:hypothetical protein
MTDWYRNFEWSPAIAADFERRLARSRHQKAQHLSLQGYALIPKHPDVARDLLQRAVALNDAHETVRALSFLATAHLALGDVDGALTAYEAALERQTVQPNIVAAQPADYLFLIGYFRAVDRIPLAVAIADAMPDEGIFGPDGQIVAAKAMIFELAGREADASEAAAKALPLLEAYGDAEALGVNIGDLRQRLEKLAEAA